MYWQPLNILNSFEFNLVPFNLSQRTSLVKPRKKIFARIICARNLSEFETHSKIIGRAKLILQSTNILFQRDCKLFFSRTEKLLKC